MYFNYSLDYINTDYFQFDNFYHRKDEYKIPTVLLPSKKNKKIDIGNIDYIVERNILDFAIRNECKFDNIENFFTIKKLQMKKNIIKIIGTRLHDIEDITTNQKFIKEGDIKKNLMYYFQEKKINEENLKILNELYIIKKIYENKNRVIEPNLKALIEKPTIEIIVINDIDKILKILQNNFDFYKIFDSESGLEKVLDCFSFSGNESKIEDLLSKKINIDEQDPDLFNYIPSWIDIEFFNENDINLKDLSYGQKFLTRFIYTMLYQIIKIGQFYKNTPFIILLDEVELGLHPQWQKEFLQLIMKVLDIYNNTSFYLVFTSHSPFLLSDIPKENVIFLKNGKQVYPNIETFGANIHTLLSHGFFMSDGLMGEFAKSKIEDIKKFYEEVQKSKTPKEKFSAQYNEKIKDFRHIQSIIGEPFLKTIVKNYLDELELIFSDNDLIDKELEALEKRKQHLEKLKNAQN